MTILWCDDEIDLLDLGCCALKYAGHKVYPFTDCLDIVQRVEDIHPEVIIMDHNMFDKDGVTAIKELKASKYSNIPVLICTGTPNPEQLVAESGADGYLAKPFGIAGLRDMVAMIAKRAA